MATKKKALVGDTTRTARAKLHLERLATANGRRVLVDLDAEATEALEALLSMGYGDTNKAVVSRALVSARKRTKSS